ncbi:hypothetical protein GF362_06115 [Candidatus Dojkabacteria bacterium]|nr:hypothetical protein [Candidatus Dojkabacteria bacterium]
MKTKEKKKQFLKNTLFFILLIFSYAIIGIIFTYPLIKVFNTHVPNNYFQEAEHTNDWGDHVQVIGGFLEHKKTIINFFTNKPIYEKEFCFSEIEYCQVGKGTDISTGWILKKIIFSAYWGQTALNFVFDPIVTNNLWIILSFVLSGVTAFLFARLFTKSNTIAFIASLFPVIGPGRIHHLLVGHRNGWLLYLFIIILFLVETEVRKKLKGGLRYTIWLFISGIMVYFSFVEPFYLMYGLIFLFSRIAWNDLFEKKIFINLKSKILPTITRYLWLVFTLASAWMATKWHRASKLQESILAEGGRTLEEITRYSPELKLFWTRNIYDHELNIYIGIGIVIIITAVFLVWFMKSRQKQRMSYYLLFGILLLILSLGINTPVYEFLYKNVPMFNLSRTPSRAIIHFLPILTAITAILFNYLKRLTINNKIKSNLLQFIIFLVITTSIIISLYNFKSISLARLPDLEVDSIEPQDKILYLPITHGGHFFTTIYEYNLAYLDAVAINGDHPYEPLAFHNFYAEYGVPLNAGWVNTQELNKIIEDYHITKIIVFKDYYNNPKIEFVPEETEINDVKTMLNSSKANIIEEDEDFIIYSIK